MKRLFFLLPVALTALSSSAAADADAKTEVKAAAKKLADKPSYSWTSTPKSEGGGAPLRQGPLQGQAEKEGFAYCQVTVNDNEIETAFKGTKSAIKWEDAWRSADELEGDNAWIASRLRAFKLPPQEAEDLLSKTSELKKGPDGLYSGDLTEEGVKEILWRWRRSQGAATHAKGWVKFWIQEGLITKYEFNVQAKLIAGDDQREIEINRTTTSEIKAISSTKVSLPEEAKKKLL